MQPINWRKQAACRGIDQALWFPPEHVNYSAEARAICAHCPVADNCRQYAIQTNQTHGMWGGTTPDDRRALRKHTSRQRNHGGRVVEYTK